MRVERLLQENPSPERRQKLLAHAQWLLSIGNDTAPSAIPNSNIIEIPEHMVVTSRIALEEKNYPGFKENYSDAKYLSERAIMSTTNDIVQQCNFEMIEKIEGDMVISASRDSCVEPDDMTRYDTDFLNKINASGISPHRLALKVGACIILIRNLSLTYGHCNGTRYIIEQLTDNLIKARKVDG